jgi:hypothetical protein
MAVPNIFNVPLVTGMNEVLPANLNAKHRVRELNVENQDPLLSTFFNVYSGAELILGPLLLDAGQKETFELSSKESEHYFRLPKNTALNVEFLANVSGLAYGWVETA